VRRERRSWRPSWLMFTPSMMILPLQGSTIRKRANVTELLPEQYNIIQIHQLPLP
jgi:hypothetical protein